MGVRKHYPLWRYRLLSHYRRSTDLLLILDYDTLVVSITSEESGSE